MLDMFMQLGTFLGVWLLVGFVVAIKIVVLERSFAKSKREELIRNYNANTDHKDIKEAEQTIDYFIENNAVVFVALTLGGILSFCLDTIATFRRKKK